MSAPALQSSQQRLGFVVLEDFRPSFEWPPDLAFGDTMTLLAALRAGRRILIAADGVARDEHGFRHLADRKLWEVPGRPIVWGYSGPVALGEQIKPSMDALVSSTWSDLVAEAADHLATVNGVWRRRSQVAGRELPDDELLQLLIAGFASKQPDIIQIAASGEHSPLGRCEATFVGGGSKAAIFGFKVLDHANSERSLRRIMSAIDLMPDMGRPMTFFEVTARGGVRELSQATG
jgi:hypothetical protein